jgi:cysteinyl-tRNA synthetase
VSIRVYNRLTRQMEPLETRRPGEIGIYSCGVTPYDLCHVGHARSAIVFDVMQRYLRARGYRVTFVRNFTDVDDKIIRRANAEGVEASVVSERYIAEFRADMAAIGVHRADVEPKATEHIGEMIGLIERLVARGVAYVVDGDVYFEVRRFADYGKLSGKNLDDLIAGARVEVDERKRDPRDFALWKSTKPGEPSWPSPWGPGRPGWHIECSAMSMKYLGESFDLHGGGDDLIFPHHECEIAQSEAATGVRFARYWVHNGMVNLGAEKMSKSLGNILTIKEIVKRFPPDALRLWVLGTHYRNPLDFSEERLAEAVRALERLARPILDTAKQPDAAPGRTPGPLQPFVDRFHAAMEDDFNTPAALGVLFELVRALRDGERADDAAAGVAALKRLAAILGLFETMEVAGPPPDVERLVAERVEARARRDWKRSDALRDEIQRLGWAVEDTAAGPRVTRRVG